MSEHMDVGAVGLECRLLERTEETRVA